jgi:hypothetical protein
MSNKLSPAARTILVGGLTAVLALSGCATVVTGSGHNSSPSTGASSRDFPSSATSSAPSTTATTATAPSPTPTVVRNITDVKYTVPSGWERNSNYHEVIPLEVSFQSKYLIPSGVTPGLDVISIILYRCPPPTWSTRMLSSSSASTPTRRNAA